VSEDVEHDEVTEEQPGDGGEGDEKGGEVYKESLFMPWWVYALVFLPLLILFAVGAVGNTILGNWGWAAGSYAVLAGLIFLVLNFGMLVFRVTDKEVEVRFGLWVRRFERSDVASCEPYELEFRNYYGYGIRPGMDGTKAYNTRSGPGIKMEVVGEKRPIVVSVDDPEKVCGLLGAK